MGKILHITVAIGLYLFLGASKALKPVKVVIDPGHGGKDPGALGKFSQEKHIALSVALALKKLLEKNGAYTPILTRSEDTFVELSQRAEMANQNKADLFVSIHCNANLKKDLLGSETYVLGPHRNQDNLDVVMRENSAILMEKDYQQTYEGFDPNSEEAYIIFSLVQHAYLKQSLQLAAQIEKRQEQHTQRKSRGVKQAGFLVLWKTSMPAVLCEIGFISTPFEEKYLASAAGQAQIAQAIYQALENF
ncbi:MAG: N-acetylmuramoyl-L-alanine amidase family protein [Bacteroidia bacterium]